MSSVLTTRQYWSLQTKHIERAYTNSGSRKPLKYPAIFNKYTGDQERSFMQFLSIIGFGQLALKTEGAIPQVDFSKEGQLSEFAFSSFALRYIITKEAMREDPKSMIPKLPGLLKYSSDQTKEYLFWNVYNYAFSNLVPLPATGLPLCAPNQPILGGGGAYGSNTFSNTLGGAPFTVETLQQAYLLMATIPDDRGLLTSYNPQKLIYPPGMHQVAMEVLASGYYPNSDENKINAVAGSIDPMPVEYITAAPAGPFPWFVLAGQGSPGEDAHSSFATVKWDEQRAYYDDPTQAMIHETEFRASWGSVEPRGTVGSMGG